MIKVVNKRRHVPTSNDFHIGRGSALGNPFSSIKDRPTKAEFIVETEAESISSYEKWLEKKIEGKDKAVIGALNKIALMALKGDVNLVCYCEPKPCHGNSLKDVIENRLGELKSKESISLITRAEIVNELEQIGTHPTLMPGQQQTNDLIETEATLRPQNLL